MVEFIGGDRLMAALRDIDDKLAGAGSGPSVRVGFLEGSTYPDGTSVPMVAAMNEWGGTIHREAGTIAVFRKKAAKGGRFLRNGRFVKRREANFSSTHAHGAYDITIPPRPFFRNMIKAKGPTWGAEIAKLLKVTGFDPLRVLTLMGELIKGQLQASIVALVSPPNAPSTIRRKGSANPLIDTGYMLSRVDYEVNT
jgi:hypothetical protein